MVLTTAAMLSLNANSATVTAQVQKISSVSSYYDYSCDLDPTYCDPYTTDYSNDDLFYTFTATLDDVTSILNLSISDGTNAQFTDGYYDDGYDSSGYYMGYSEHQYVSINVSNGKIISFHAVNDSTDDISMSNDSLSWVFNGNQLIRNHFYDYDQGMHWSQNILTYDVISPSEVPLPAGIYLFLSGLVGLGLMRERIVR